MKARFFKNISSGLVLSALPFVGGCDQETTGSPPPILSAAQAEPLIAPDDNSVVLTGEPVAPEASPPPPEDKAAPAPAPNSGKTLPPNIKPSRSAGEVVKLAQSGVDESVMLSFISNSMSMFNLSSDEIIYFNDIGTPTSVVQAMIQHDQALKKTSSATVPTQNAAAQASAEVLQGAAPSYVNPPQPETQPVQTVDAEVPPPPQPVNVSYNYFYDSLAPYGSWVDVPGYGSCWQPTVVVVNRAWRPYCNGGRWVYTDCGWYWYSDYSWGWAPFHYGRWISDARLGWCWSPGYTWGPAWVSWRYTDGYCGWAPLPPAASYTYGIGFTYYGGSVGVSFGFGLGYGCYAFVPWTKFCGYKPYKYCASPHQAQQIYQNSTVINNYVSGKNNTIINQGIPLDSVRRHTGAEIRQVSIRETRNANVGNTRGERFERDGRTLIVRRPQISQTSTVAAPPSRFASDLQPGHMSSAGAGAAALIEPVRGQGFDRNPVQSLPVTSHNPRNSSPMASLSPSGTLGTPRGQDERSQNPNREVLRDNGRPSLAFPLAVRGGDRTPKTSLPTPPTTGSKITAPSAPRGSFVMIGRRDSNPNRVGNSSDSQRPTQNTSTFQKPPPGSLIMIGRRDSDLNGNGQSAGDRASPPSRIESLTRNNYNRPVNRTVPATQPSATVSRGQTPYVPTPKPPSSFSYNRPAMGTLSYQRFESPRQAAPPSRPNSVTVPVTPTPRTQPMGRAYSAPRATPAPAYSAPNFRASRPSPTPARSYTPASAPQRSQFGQSSLPGRNSR